MEKYRLDQVFIADAGDGPSETQFTSFTRQCAQQLESIMPDNANIGVMSGKTISAVAKQFPSARKKHLHFIPLVGAIGNSGNDWNANSIARILAFKTDSSYSVLNAPGSDPKSEGKRLFCTGTRYCKCPERRRTLRYGFSRDWSD